MEAPPGRQSCALCSTTPFLTFQVFFLFLEPKNFARALEHPTSLDYKLFMAHHSLHSFTFLSAKHNIYKRLSQSLYVTHLWFFIFSFGKISTITGVNSSSSLSSFVKLNNTKEKKASYFGFLKELFLDLAVSFLLPILSHHHSLLPFSCSILIFTDNFAFHKLDKIRERAKL